MSKYCYDMMCDVLAYKTKFLNPSIIQLVNQELEYHAACQTLLAKLGNLEERFRSVKGQDQIQRVDYDPYKFIRGRNLFSTTGNLNTDSRLMEEKHSLLQDKKDMTGNFQYNTSLPLQHYQVGNEMITTESAINQVMGDRSQSGSMPMTGTMPMTGNVSQTGLKQGTINSGQMTSTVPGQIHDNIQGQSTLFSGIPGYDKNLIYPSLDQFNISNSDDEDEIEESGINTNLQNMNLNYPTTTTGVSNILNTQQLSTGGIESYTNRSPTIMTSDIDTLEQPLEENVSPRFQGQVSPRYKQGFSFQESNLGQGANVQQMPSTTSEIKNPDPQIIPNQNMPTNL
jgi:hypothetical protein